MVKKPTRHDEPAAQAAPEPQPTQAESAPMMMQSTPEPRDATSDANTVAIIQQQLDLIGAQNTAFAYLFGQLPTSTETPPTGSDLQAITDTLAGASRALGAVISQLTTLGVLWPPTTSTTVVNGNGGTP